MVGAVFAVAAVDPHIDRMLFLRLGNRGVQEYDTNQRFYTQRRAIEAVERHPLGIGPGHAELDFNNVATHSMYLRALSENGIAGFLALYALVGLSLLRAFRMSATLPNQQWRALFTIVGACSLGMLVNGIVIDAIHWRHLWLLLALAWVSHPSMYRAEASAASRTARRTSVIPGPRHENRLYRHSRG
jgi:O-antigen ligase